MAQKNIFPALELPENLSFELSSLAKAVHYQNWVYQTVHPFLGKRILEVGAGIGNMSRWLPLQERLIFTELDPALLTFLQKSIGSQHGNDPRVSVIPFDLVAGDLDLLIQENLDTVVSFNVLEHIEDDTTALRRLVEVVQKSKSSTPKRVITFVPAHPWAYGELDRFHGHFRRYTRNRLETIFQQVAPDAHTHFQYFNAFGLLGWFVNAKLLGKSDITEKDIERFEALCPWLKGTDDFLHQKLKLPLGQSLLGVLEFR